jgi:hypothetical protein
MRMSNEHVVRGDSATRVDHGLIPSVPRRVIDAERFDFCLSGIFEFDACLDLNCVRTMLSADAVCSWSGQFKLLSL